MTVLTAMKDVLRKWREQGTNFLPPNKEADVIVSLDKIGRKYSYDVIALYCVTGGMRGDEFDSHAWTLWPLDRVVSENSHYNRPYILFADFLINSHCYCFTYEDDERSSVCIEYFNGEEPERVANSVNEFFETYLSNPRKLDMFE